MTEEVVKSVYRSFGIGCFRDLFLKQVLHMNSTRSTGATRVPGLEWLRADRGDLGFMFYKHCRASKALNLFQILP